MKQTICTVTGITGSMIAGFFGGWTSGMTTLLICMIVDYVTGLIIAGVFGRSNKSETGALDSKAGWRGLCRKCMTMVFVLIAYRLDLVLGTAYIRDAVVIGFICNEVISIIENAGIIGMPMPKALTKAVELLKSKEDE